MILILRLNIDFQKQIRTKTRLGVVGLSRMFVDLSQSKRGKNIAWRKAESYFVGLCVLANFMPCRERKIKETPKPQKTNPFDVLRFLVGPVFAGKPEI